MRRKAFPACGLAQECTLYRVAKTLLPWDEDCADAVPGALLRGHGRKNSRKELMKEEFSKEGQ